MDTSTPATELIPVKGSTGAKSKRQYRTIAEKRRIVEETLAEGASVARVARAHGVNANQVLHWRKLYLVGRLGSASGAERAGRDQAGTETVLGASSKIPTTPQRMRRFSFAYQMLGGSVGFLQRSAP